VRAILHLSNPPAIACSHHYSGGYRNALASMAPYRQDRRSGNESPPHPVYIPVIIIYIYIICTVVNASHGDYNIKHVYLYVCSRILCVYIHIEGEKRVFILLRDACRPGRSCDTHAATNDIIII